MRRELGLPGEIVNVEDGAIAHGHQIGATGALLTTRLILTLRRDGLKRGVVRLRIGGGQGNGLANLIPKLPAEEPYLALCQRISRVVADLAAIRLLSSMHSSPDSAENTGYPSFTENILAGVGPLVTNACPTRPSM